eukprot:1730262-Amphidinium_carterae.1
MVVLWFDHQHFTPAKDMVTLRQVAGNEDVWVAPLTNNHGDGFAGGCRPRFAGGATSARGTGAEAIYGSSNLHTCSPYGPILDSQSIDLLKQKGPKLLSWNVNSLSSEQDPERFNMLASLDADILCLVETKKSVGEITTLTNILRRKGLYSVWSPAERFINGYVSAGATMWS